MTFPSFEAHIPQLKRPEHNAAHSLRVNYEKISLNSALGIAEGGKAIAENLCLGIPYNDRLFSSLHPILKLS
jgi:hypothetical protein